MLLEFGFENFKCYKNKVLFSLAAGEGLRRFKKENTFVECNERLLKSAYIFGANGSGKTTILEALLVFRRMVIEPVRDSVSPLRWFPFAGSLEPTRFSITFFKNGKEYMYFLDYDGKQVISEDLIANECYIFRRYKQEMSVHGKQEGLETVRTNQLLLYWAQDKNVPEAMEAFEWFAKDIVCLTEKVDNDRFFNEEEGKILKNPAFKEKLISFLKAVDFHIEGYALIEQREENPMQKLLAQWGHLPYGISEMLEPEKRSAYDMIIEHRINGEMVNFTLSSESAGLKRLVRLLVNILPEAGSGQLFLLDGLEKDFHIEILKVIVKLMNEWNQGNQFIATTHQLDVMNFDLRSDQIYFADKNYEGLSEIYSVFDFADTALTRNDFDYKKKYSKGLYDGTAIINWAQLQALLSEEDKE